MITKWDVKIDEDVVCITIVSRNIIFRYER